jgi:hypothetical protein
VGNLSDTNSYRLIIFSFDFPQAENQVRKSKFFRRLYGQTKRIIGESEMGEKIEKSYQYPGVLSQMPHIKLGKSVFAVHPGDDESILELFNDFRELTYHRFVGWVPLSNVASIKLANQSQTSKFITTLGYLSLLLFIDQKNAKTDEDLINSGFDLKFIDSAVDYLKKKRLISDSKGGYKCTQQGQELAKLLTVFWKVD